MQAPVSETLRAKLTRINAELREAGRPDSFYTSLEAAWNRYGSLTERQEAALIRSFAQREERLARRAQENTEVTQPMPTGRVTISGEIVSTKWQHNDFGGAWKMLVKSDAGWQVWGTIPRGECDGNWSVSNENLREHRVTFTATIEPKEAAFGFFSRPTKAVFSRPNRPASSKPGQHPEAPAPIAPVPAAPVVAAAVPAHEEVTKQDYRGHAVTIRGTRELGWALSIDNGPLFCADRLQQVVYRAESFNTAFAVARQLIDKEAPAPVVAKPSLADIIAKAKELEARKSIPLHITGDWDTDSMVA